MAHKLFIAINPDDQFLGADTELRSLQEFLHKHYPRDLEGTTIYHCTPVYEGKCEFEWDPC